MGLSPFPRILDIPREFPQLLSGLVSTIRLLGLECGNGAVCKVTTELNPEHEIEVLILSFCFNILSLLRGIASLD